MATFTRAIRSKVVMKMVAIKDMEMPKECWQCELLDEHGLCGITGDNNFSDCPLLEIDEHNQKLEKIEQIVARWNNDASHSFEDMCNINRILKE